MKRIIVIDDDSQFLSMIEEMLNNEGHEVISAIDGNIGMNLFREKGSDLIITDLLMLEKNGVAIIKEVKKDFPDIKVIAMSGGGRIGPEKYLSLAKESGADMTLEKPFEKAELIKGVEELLSLAA